ncbi:tyrosine-protein phosphatase [Fructilactobacillus myrtifloralis]|uniref:Tyrosine-protein phosphatase n=1 Tax=Fructilactobacillus myrtifloralis TaxID=2940301 RepID=A0ABY5BLQ7_9LACO|nr:tyrosine-protein phosphatase [Fructilactobacillus myrtifloralis]USS84454.1 tyrosine-protein phosphatase [Fructilactobacillus myrtifloralis]
MKNERIIKLDSTENLRELGGYQTTDGRTIKWHKLLRSGSLGLLTPTDQAFLEAYGVRYDVDFRSGQERTTAPDAVTAGQIEYLFDPVFDEDRTDNSQDPAEFRQMLEDNPNYAHDHMVDVYQRMVLNDGCHQAYRRFFKILLQNDQPEQTLLFHCTAGKDRTGMAAVFLLAALGVDLETIKQDYILTNQVVKDVVDQKMAAVRAEGFSEAAIRNLRELYTVDMDFLDAALATINEHYGSLDQYLSDVLGVGTAERERLQALYLEPNHH